MKALSLQFIILDFEEPGGVHLVLKYSDVYNKPLRPWLNPKCIKQYEMITCFPEMKWQRQKDSFPLLSHSKCITLKYM